MVGLLRPESADRGQGRGRARHVVLADESNIEANAPDAGCVLLNLAATRSWNREPERCGVHRGPMSPHA
jgi:hypothetical protein